MVKNKARGNGENPGSATVPEKLIKEKLFRFHRNGKLG
jgi:hypothetical protein